MIGYDELKEHFTKILSDETEPEDVYSEVIFVSNELAKYEDEKEELMNKIKELESDISIKDNRIANLRARNEELAETQIATFKDVKEEVEKEKKEIDGVKIEDVTKIFED